MTDLVKAIQRMARTEELKKAIEDLLNGSSLNDRGKIKSTSFIAYQNRQGGISGASGGSAEELDELNTDDVFAQDLEDALEELGLDIESNTDDLLGDLDNTWDLQDIVDDGLKIGDEITTLEGLFNCSDLSGNEAQIHMTEFVPPDIPEWEGQNADYDPTEGLFRQGYYYEATGVSVNRSSSVWGAAVQALAELDAVSPPNAPHSVSSVEDYDPDSIADGAGILVSFTRKLGAPGELTVTIRKTGCTVGVDDWCPISNPDDFKWQSDGVHQLKFNGGNFETSPLESPDDLLNDYLNSPSFLSGCTSGGDSVEIQPSGEGGIIISPGSGDFNGDNFVTDSSGEVIDIVSDADLDKYLPR